MNVKNDFNSPLPKADILESLSHKFYIHPLCLHRKNYSFKFQCRFWDQGLMWLLEADYSPDAVKGSSLTKQHLGVYLVFQYLQIIIHKRHRVVFFFILISFLQYLYHWKKLTERSDHIFCGLVFTTISTLRSLSHALTICSDHCVLNFSVNF